LETVESPPAFTFLNEPRNQRRPRDDISKAEAAVHEVRFREHAASGVHVDESGGKEEVSLQEAIAEDPGMELLAFADGERGEARLEEAKEGNGAGRDGAAKHVREASEGVVAGAAFAGDGD
jgi:hypothetical protein